MITNEIDRLKEENYKLKIEIGKLYLDNKEKQAEIERLQKHNTEMARRHYQDGRAEAIKEFANKVNDSASCGWVKSINQIATEMVGEIY